MLDSEDRRPYERTGASIRAPLGADVFERVWREGYAMSIEQATAYALASVTVWLEPAGLKPGMDDANSLGVPLSRVPGD